jgi:FtsH-binding integral membrane protein
MAYENYELDYPIERSTVTDERTAFIRRVYAHLAGAILAFVALEAFLMNFVITDIQQVAALLGGGTPWGLLFVMIAFIAAGWIARTWARGDNPPAMQYLGLGLYIVAQALIMLPILFIATHFIPNGTSIIWNAGILTLCVFAGLTITVFLTKKDYSGLAPVLAVGTMIAFGVIICGILFGFNLGLFFSFAMVALFSGYILYDTSNVLHHYNTNQHVAAALELFADAAILFFYILRILIELQGNRN